MDVANKIEIGRRLRDAREKAGLTQADVSKTVGVTQGLVSQWESGKIPEGCCEVTAIGVLVGLQPNTLYLSDVSSRARSQTSAAGLSVKEEGTLGVIVDALLRLRRRGVPLADTAGFLTSFLKAAPAGSSPQSSAPPDPAEAVEQARLAVQEVLVQLPVESVHHQPLYDAAILLEQLAAIQARGSAPAASSGSSEIKPKGALNAGKRSSHRKT